MALKRIDKKKKKQGEGGQRKDRSLLVEIGIFLGGQESTLSRERMKKGAFRSTLYGLLLCQRPKKSEGRRESSRMNDSGWTSNMSAWAEK